MPRKPKTIPIEPEQDEIETTEPETKPVSQRVSSVSDSPKATVVKSAAPNAKSGKPNWIWWVVAGVIVIGAVLALGWKLFGAPDTTTTKNTNTTNTNTVVQNLVPRALDGVLVKGDAANTNIQAVMIENELTSRPPSGLDHASVVYEALAEGGITRFMGLFPVGGDHLAQIGPVRSARPYFVNWAEEYKALYTHAGGSPQALTYLQSGKANVVDFNQFSHGGNFIRDDSRAAPHNLYTNSDLLYNGLRNTVLRNATPTFTPWTFKDETPLDGRPEAVKDITINFSSFSYKVTYKYDRGQNRYVRYLADKPHITRDGSQIYAKDVVVLFEKTTVLPNDHQRLDITTTGTGKLLMFRDGTVTEGTWSKESKARRTEFLGADGKVLPLNPGAIWVEVVPTDRTVTYQ